MRTTLLLPPRRSWPITAAAAGRAYEWKSHRPEIPLTGTFSILPDGRYQLRIDGLIPIILSRSLFAATPEQQCWVMVRLLALEAVFFCCLRGLPVPWRTACFVQCGEEFFLEDGVNPYRYAKLRVPRRSVVARG